MSKKVLITGASGFVGSYLIESALNKGYEVYAGLRTSSSRRYLKDDRIRFFEVDFSKQEQLRDSLRAFSGEKGGFDYVIHNAGVTRAKTEEAFVTGNADFTASFAGILQDSQPEMKKFVFISSLAAYGPGDEKTFAPVKDSDTPNPITPYGLSKCLGEKKLTSIPGLPYLIFRPTAVYGPRDTNFLQLFQLINRGIEPRLTSSRQRLSFVYAKDLADVITESLKTDISRKGYFVSDGNTYSPRYLNQLVKEVYGKRTIPVVIPPQLLKLGANLYFPIAKLRGRIPHLSPYKIKEVTSLNWKCDIEPLKSDFGFTPKYTLETGIKEVADWYKEEGVL